MLTSNLKVLIAEDDIFSQKLIAEILKDIHIADIHFAKSGAEVLAKVDSALNPDVLLCDLNMPGVDGIDLLRLLGERKFAGEIIIISGCDKRIIKSACKIAVHSKLKLAGALEKPLNSERLKRMMLNCGAAKQSTPSSVVKQQFQFSREEIKQAICSGHMVPYFQPLVDVNNGKLESVECLARWQHPARGLILPNDFLPQVAAYDLLDEFSEMIFVAALKEFKSLHEVYKVPHMDFNVPPQILHKSDAAARFLQLVKAAGFKAGDIVMEVLETSYQGDKNMPVAMLNHLRLKGFGLLVDDYGTGYSSLDRITDVHVTGIKIDKRFVLEAYQDEVACSIIRNTVHLAKELKVKTVAEGIENMDDWALMRDLGCDYIQGYLVARPKIASQFKVWLNSWEKIMDRTGVLAC